MYTEELLKFLREIDRVLTKNGILVISAPLSQYRFYETLTHIKPYGPDGLIHYMCGKEEKKKSTRKTMAPADGGVVSDKYIVKELIYSYKKGMGGSVWGSKYLIISIIMKILEKIFRFLGFSKYTKSGYTLILKKQ